MDAFPATFSCLMHKVGQANSVISLNNKYWSLFKKAHPH